MRGHQRGQGRPVEVLADRDGVGDGVRGKELQRDGHVAEREVEVDKGDRALAGVSYGRGEVGREGGLATAALGREDRDDTTVPLPDVRTIAGVDGLTQSYGDLALATYCGREARQIAFLDDFAHPSTKSVGQDRCVDATADHHDAEARTSDAHVLSKEEHVLLVDTGSEHDAVLEHVDVEVGLECVEAGKHGGVRSQGALDRLRCQRVEFHDRSHAFLSSFSTSAMAA